MANIVCSFKANLAVLAYYCYLVIDNRISQNLHQYLSMLRGTPFGFFVLQTGFNIMFNPVHDMSRNNT